MLLLFICLLLVFLFLLVLTLNFNGGSKYQIAAFFICSIIVIIMISFFVFNWKIGVSMIALPLVLFSTFNRISSIIAFRVLGYKSTPLDDYQRIKWHKAISDSINDYTKASRIEPNNVEVCNNRGLAWIKTKITQSNYFSSGMENYKLGYYMEAIKNFNRAIKIDPKFARYYFARGLAKTQLEDYTGAIEDFNKGIDLKPKEAEAYDSRGWVKEQLGDYTGAIKDYNKAIALKPKLARAYFSRGIARTHLDDYTGAMEDFSKAGKWDMLGHMKG